MEVIHCQRRLTHRYVQGWSHLDAWKFMRSIKVTPAKMIEEGNGYDEGGTYLRYCRIPAGVDWKKIALALEDSFSHSGCRHEYDCCGCSFTDARVKKYGRRQLQIRIRVSYNY